MGRFNNALLGAIMITIRVTADVRDDRQLVLTLPPEVPVGKTELVITIDAPAEKKKPPRTSLAEWAEANAEDWGDRMNSKDVEGFTGRRF
jgi:hypothetical protein